jgi:hypothetical protein
VKSYDLLQVIYEDCQTPFATVEVPTIAGCDKPLYEPVLRFVQGIKAYNAFKGPKVAAFLRKHLHDAKHGPIIHIRFGREYSPVLYLTLAVSEFKNGDYRHLPYQERRKLTADFLKQCRAELKPDSASIVSSGAVRLWWD